ncbi:MAG: hypothetical protein AB1427_07985 [Thermodesulfobacteriota bacterium]
MMIEVRRIKGWMMLAYTLFLGPFFLVRYFRETRNVYPAARYFAWLSLLAMGLCAALAYNFTISPFVIRIIYLTAILSLFGLAFFYCWGLDAKSKIRTPGPKQEYSFSRACAWMIVMAVLFSGVNNVVQAAYYWIFGEQLSVYFSAQANIFKFWMLVGLIYGFFYGIRKSNDYFNRDIVSAVRAVVFVLLFIILFNGLVLALIIYPLQRLSPVSYFPQSGEFLFYLLFFIAIALSAIYLLQAANHLGALKAGVMLCVGIPLILVHVIVVSAYSVTINLTIASFLEDRGAIASAKAHYAKAIPHIRYDNLLASLHHRQGVLHVLNQDYESAAASFKKVLADYCEGYEAFRKARMYMAAYEKNKTKTELGRKILVVKHQTFEQAASCFPNSLSVILSFYEKQPVSTRSLSYAIKESFATGAFIWKAETFLAKNGYDLHTTFWQNKETLISLLEAGYPVLVFVPGHVYTLYGYDARMEMFFTYDTAKSNRWDDKPYWSFQRDWMKGSFLMSVVVPKAEKEKFTAAYAQFGRYSWIYQQWQKAHISDYYESRGNYWKDYDRYQLSQSFGIDRLKMNEPYFLSDDFFPLPWDAEDWISEVWPVLRQSWAQEWSIMEKYILYLIYSGQSKPALQLIEIYQSHLPAEPSTPFPQLLKLRQFFQQEPSSIYSQVMELKLAAAVDARNARELLSAAEKLIGITGNNPSASYWGHYFKARDLMASGDLKGAADLLLSALENFSLGEQSPPKSFSYIVDALNEVHLKDSSVIDPAKMRLIEIARIDLASGR